MIICHICQHNSKSMHTVPSNTFYAQMVMNFQEITGYICWLLSNVCNKFIATVKEAYRTEVKRKA